MVIQLPVPRTLCGRLNYHHFQEIVHIPILGRYKYVTLYSQGDFEDVMKLRIFKWGDYSGLSG